MKFSEIEKEYASRVEQYLAEGYIFHTKTMAGHQGEIARVDLYKGREMIRIWMKKTCDYEKDVEAINVIVGEWKKPANSDDIAWEDDFRFIWRGIWYKVDKDWYLVSEKEAITCREKHWNRYRKEEGEKVIENEQAKDIAVKYLKRKQIAKRISKGNVEVEKRFDSFNNETYYDICYKGQSFRLKTRKEVM